MRQPHTPFGSGPGAALSRLLEASDLAQRLPRLPARDFSALVQHLGVHDAGELVALATTQQLQAALDEDIFASEAPGAPEEIDGGRFVTWLEVLLEAGPPAAATRVAALSEDYLTLALSKVVLVLDSVWLSLPKSERSREVISDDELESAARGRP
ncbi:MAG: DUF6178 family protein [Myxococcales bacterium]|nr:DUF6178 family protein [Myxococcales bacterium]